MTIKLFAILYIILMTICVLEAYFAPTFKDDEE